MSIDASTKLLDLEHELAPTKDSGSSETPSGTGRNRETQTKGFRADSQNDDNDPVKLRERLARLQADFENARKRSLKEQKEFQEYALFDTAKALLPVVDSLEQALQASTSNGGDLRAGVELIRRQLMDILFKMGVRPIKAIGEHFDPQIHHAIATADTDLVKDGTVVGEYQPGYWFKERLLRPAMVTVARELPTELSQ